MRRISKREITDFNETSWESGPQCREFKNAEESAENLTVFLIAKSVLRPALLTPSTQLNLFPILICFFLIPKEIPLRKPI